MRDALSDLRLALRLADHVDEMSMAVFTAGTFKHTTKSDGTPDIPVEEAVEDYIRNALARDYGAAWDYAALGVIVDAAGGRFSCLDASTVLGGVRPALFATDRRTTTPLRLWREASVGRELSRYSGSVSRIPHPTVSPESIRPKQCEGVVTAAGWDGSLAGSPQNRRRVRK